MEENTIAALCCGGNTARETLIPEEKRRELYKRQKVLRSKD